MAPVGKNRFESNSLPEWPDRSPVEGTDGDQVNHNHETGENADEI